MFLSRADRSVARGRLAMVIAALTAALAATPALAASRTVRSGVATPVLAYGTFNNDNCLQGPLPILRLAGAPRHGTVQLGRGDQPNTSPRCPGTKVRSVIVVYRSTPGYRGSDTVVLDVETELFIDGRGSRGDRVTIDLDVK